MSTLIGLLVLFAAVAVSGIEIAVGPKQRRFPCVNRVTIWVLRGFALSLAGAAFDRLYHSLYLHEPLDATILQLNAALWMFMAVGVLFYQVLKMRLPEGVWPYLQIRVSRAKNASKAGGEVGAVLARAAARPRDRAETASIAASGLYQTPKGWNGLLQNLLRLP